jgi:ABC-type Fe3+-hydroxamate transport system substrate-binding protein
MSIERSIEEILNDLPENGPRIVSLVPSYTESLFDLGFGKSVVGITDFCSRPLNELAHIPRVGGVADARVEVILALAPDLVIANQEENRPETINALSERGLKVWLTFPKSVEEMMDVLVGMVALFHDEQASVKVRMLETALDWVSQATEQSQMRFFAPVWQERTPDGTPWWMTFNRQTYSSDLLERLGGCNIFANRVRRYPLDADLGTGAPEPAGERDVRYPRVTVSEVLAAQPEVILLPDEPFVFDEAGAQEVMNLLRETPAVQAGRVYRIEGRLITWCGTSIAAALSDLSGYFRI